MKARFLVLTEDSGKQAQSTIQKLTKLAAQLVVPGLDTRQLDMRPLLEGDPAAKALRANAWKEKHSPDRQRLLGEIASRLVEAGSFVVFHVDSDTVWASRRASDNRLKFEKLIRMAVRSILMGAAPPPVGRSRKPMSEAEATAALRRLFVMHPCYSIESWLYQATAEVKTHCRSAHDDADHLAQIDSWAADRTCLDEVMRPKDDVLGTCVKDLHNEALAAAFPSAEVRAAQRSWHEFVTQMESCQPLRDCLAAQA